MTKEKSKRAAVYIRVSSDEAAKEGYSPQTQEEKAKEFIKTNGYKLDKNHIYIDLGHSGSTEKRPGLQRFLNDAENKEFEIVIVYRQDRFFRNLELLLNTIKRLRELGVEFKSITEPFDTSTPTGRAMFANAGVFAEWQREITLEARNEGMIRAMKEGKWLGGTPPYGYRINNKFLEIEPKEAKVVKMIFEWLVYEGLSQNKIQERINSMKIPTKQDILGRKKSVNAKYWWCKRTVGRMLRSRVYTGTFHYRKYKDYNRIRDIYTPKNNIRPKSDWIKVKVPVVISEELFVTAQKQMEENRNNSPRRTKRKYLFQHKIVCGHDGRKWQSACTTFPKKPHRKGVKYYFCPGTRKWATSKKCLSPTAVSESRIAPAVWEPVVSLLFEPEAIMKSLKKYQGQKSGKLEMEKRLKQVSKYLKTKEGQQKRLTQAFILGGINDEGKYKSDLEKIKDERARLLSEKTGLSQLLVDGEEKGKRIESIKTLYNKMKKGLESADYELKRLIIQKLVKEITIKDDEMDIEFQLPTLEFASSFRLRDSRRMDCPTKQTSFSLIIRTKLLPHNKK